MTASHFGFPAPLSVPQSVGKLSQRSADIFQLIARGYDRAQILAQYSQYSELDIACAAREALVLNASALTRDERIARIKKKFARAYEGWSEEEENMIRQLYFERRTIRQIAALIQRQPNAVKSRLERLGVRQWQMH